MSTIRLTIIPVVVAIFAMSSTAQAALVTYIGADDGVSNLSQMTNSQAAASAFGSAVTGATVIDFESAVPGGVAIAGGSITNNSGCGALCGFNTTSGGANFLSLFGGSTTFSFATPIDAFGMYITGLQTNLVAQQTLTYFDGSTVTINTPAAINGGGAFMGFTDFGAAIVSVSYNATNDVIALDDVRFATSTATVPEPATFGLFGLALAGLGIATRRRKRSRGASRNR